MALYGGLPIHFGNTSKPLNRDGRVPAACRPPMWHDQVKMLRLGRSVSGLHAEDRSSHGGVEPWRGAGKSVRPIELA